MTDPTPEPDSQIDAMLEAQEFLYGIAEKIRKGVEVAQQLGRTRVRVHAQQDAALGGRVLDRTFRLRLTADGRGTREHQKALRMWTKHTLGRLAALGSFELTVAALP